MTLSFVLRCLFVVVVVVLLLLLLLLLRASFTGFSLSNRALPGSRGQSTHSVDFEIDCSAAWACMCLGRVLSQSQCVEG